MTKDYYAILEVARHASTEDICLAFRRLSLLRHPTRSSENTVLFADTAEAFEVLSNPRLRSEFDHGGYFALRRAGYEFMGEPHKIFENFFGTEEFHDAALRFEKDLLQPISRLQPVPRAPPADVHVALDVELSALFMGASLPITFDRNELVTEETNIVRKTVCRILELIPGPFQKEIVLRGEGNQEHGYPHANVVVQTNLLLPSGTRIDRTELIITHDISLLDALLGRPFRLIFPDGGWGMVPVDGVVTPTSRIRVAERGLPLSANQRADLVVEFRIVFPEFLTLEQKEQLRTIL